MLAHAGDYFKPSGDDDNPNYSANPDYVAKGAVDVYGQCALGKTLTEVQVANLKGSKFVFVTSDGKTSTIALNGTVDFRGIPDDASNDPGASSYTGGTYSNSTSVEVGGISAYRNMYGGSINIGTKTYSVPAGTTVNNPDLPVFDTADFSRSGSTGFTPTDIKIFDKDGNEIAEDVTPSSIYASYVTVQKANSMHYKDTIQLTLYYSTNGDADPYNLEADGVAGGHIEFTADGKVNKLPIPADAAIYE